MALRRDDWLNSNMAATVLFGDGAAAALLTVGDIGPVPRCADYKNGTSGSNPSANPISWSTVCEMSQEPRFTGLRPPSVMHSHRSISLQRGVDDKPVVPASSELKQRVWRSGFSA
jgi:3-oxoacyl-[acyl-carrier-protein] synthase III